MDIKKILSLDQLTEYNGLIDCMSKIRETFIECNEQAQKQGKTVLEYVDEDSEMGKLLKCCGIWMVRDCWVDAAKSKCSDEQVEMIINTPTKLMPQISDFCSKYPSDSWRCYTPHFIVGGILFSVVIFFLLFVTILVILYRKKQQRKRKQKLHEGNSISSNSMSFRNDNNLNNNNNNNVHNNNAKQNHNSIDELSKMIDKHEPQHHSS